MPVHNHVRIGLAVGGGTGPELAAVFERALAHCAAAGGRTVSVVRAGRVYRTYWPIATMPPAAAAQAAEEDAAHYVDYVRALARDGVHTVFRTAFNAQALYRVRDLLMGVKVERLPHAGGEVLLVRDQAQGFYGGENDAPEDPAHLRRQITFSRERTWRVLDFARAEAAARWGGAAPIERLVVACKFHLLDSRFATWIREYAAWHDTQVDLWQPDTTNRHLLRGTPGGRTVIVGANEWADIMHADLVARFGLGRQEERCTENRYLHPDVAAVREFQTVHGSADDLEGRGLVNPFATLRAVAQAYAHATGDSGCVARMESAIASARAGGWLTPDLGGAAGTEEVTTRVLAAWDDPAIPASAGSALVVVDLQHDFCAAGGRFDQLGLIEPARLAALAGRIGGAVKLARAQRVPVLFAQTLADPAALPGTIAQRLARTGREGYLQPGSRGADFFHVTPAAGERVFAKTAYDVILNPEFEAHLRDRGIQRLVLAGVFTDVCVDAIARTAYQKGYRVAVLRDATVPLQRDQAECLAFMRRFYDAELVSLEELEATWTLPPPNRTAVAS